MNDMGNGYKGTSGDVLRFKSNKTIIGVKAGLTVKCSFQISGVENIIVRNLIIRGPGNSNSEQNWMQYVYRDPRGSGLTTAQ
jgi:pectate lyase